MPAPYSLDLRKKIVENLEEGKETISSVAKWFRVSYDFVSSLWKKYQETGNIAPKKIGGYTKPKVNKAGEETIENLAAKGGTFADFRRIMQKIVLPFPVK